MVFTNLALFIDLRCEFQILKKSSMNHIFGHDLPIICNENVSLLKENLTGDEKWILFNDMISKRSWGK